MELHSRNNHEEANEEHAKARQRVINAFHRTFRSEDGAIVLNALEAVFRFSAAAFEAKPSGRLDPYEGALRDGQANVKRYIDYMLTLPVQGDANVEGKRKVIR